MTIVLAAVAATFGAGLAACLVLLAIMGRQKRADDKLIADQRETISGKSWGLRQAHQQLDEHAEEICNLRVQLRRYTDPLSHAHGSVDVGTPIFAELTSRVSLELPAAPVPPTPLPDGGFLVEPDLILPAEDHGDPELDDLDGLSWLAGFEPLPAGTNGTGA